jgi:hypothetical protein
MKPISRRNMLSKTSWLGTTVAVGLPLATTAAESLPSTTPPTKPKLKVVVTGGHSGDPEYGCGGTIARYTALGHEVVLLYLNRGEWPENPLLEDAKSVRMAEAKKACEILKARPAYAGQLTALRSLILPITRNSDASWRRSSLMSSSPTGRSTTTPTIGRFRCWSMTPG